MLKTNERRYKRTCGLCGLESSIRIKNIMGYVSLAGCRTLVSIWTQAIAGDRKRQNMVLSSAIVCDHDGSQTISQNCVSSMTADDRRTFCDRLRSYGKQPLIYSVSFLRLLVLSMEISKPAVLIGCSDSPSPPPPACHWSLCPRTWKIYVSLRTSMF